MQQLKKQIRAAQHRLVSLSTIDWIIVLIVVSGGFLRLYNLSDSLQFLGDQGRDALLVARIFKELDPVFIGPVTSVGNMYLGPLYYYFMLPWLWLTYPSPMGPQYAVAILGIVTTWLVWKLGKQMVGTQAAAIATFLYAFSAVIVEYSRFSWNPNPIPLVSLLMVYSTFRAVKGAFWHWILVGVYGSIILQLHYMAALTGVAAIIIWIYQVINHRKSKKEFSQLIRSALIAGLLLLLSFTPLLLFDVKNGWLNTHAFVALLTEGNNFSQAGQLSIIDRIWKILSESHGRSMHILFELFIGQHRIVNTSLIVLYVVVFTFLAFKKSSEINKKKLGFWILITWLLVGIVGTSFYQHSVFHHYLGFMYPVAALLSGVVLAQLLQVKVVGPAALLIICIGYLLFNIPKMPLRDAGWTIQNISSVAAEISSRVRSGEQYNIVLFSHTKDLYGMNYRYYLETGNVYPVREANWNQAQTLFVIDEEKIGPSILQAPVHEIVTFPYFEPPESFTVEGIQVWVLRRKT